MQILRLFYLIYQKRFTVNVRNITKPPLACSDS